MRIRYGVLHCFPIAQTNRLIWLNPSEKSLFWLSSHSRIEKEVRAK